jgi:ATP-dependent DNA helicase RecQ
MEEKKEQAKELLKIHYGYDSFRPGQEKVIDNILNKKSTVVIMPTGGGKSLCYQLPALVMDGVTIVVSPLIALMKDQVDGLTKIGIPATFINSTVSLIETQKRLAEVRNGTYKLLYIAPERFYNTEFMKIITSVEVSLFAIDEAHCISQWGHDFRPSYMRLKEVVKTLNNPTVLALTATATPSVKNDIIKQLELEKPEIVVTGFARPNLHFAVARANESTKPAYVLEAIESVNDGVGIIYVGTRAKADQLHEYLLENDIKAAAYHAGMDPGDRKWVQDSFIKDELQVIIATNAFGLGIDKPNIRLVVHYDMPGTVEAYYQEAGRAGRDGKDSYCLLLHNSRDRHLHEFFIKGDNPPPGVIREIYYILLSYEADTVMATYAELSEGLVEKVPDMAIGTAIKILEKEKLIARSTEKKGNAYFKLLKDEKTVLDSFTKRAKKQIEVFTKLIGRYSKELKNGYYLNLEEVAGVLEVKKDAIVRLAKKLDKDSYMEYKPPFRGTEIRILKRIEDEELNIDDTELKEKLKFAYDRLDKMENYVYANRCRQKYILGYFGDHNAHDCGKCDWCLRS